MLRRLRYGDIAVFHKVDIVKMRKLYGVFVPDQFDSEKPGGFILLEIDDDYDWDYHRATIETIIGKSDAELYRYFYSYEQRTSYVHIVTEEEYKTIPNVCDNLKCCFDIIANVANGPIDASSKTFIKKDEEMSISNRIYPDIKDLVNAAFNYIVQTRPEEFV